MRKKYAAFEKLAEYVVRLRPGYAHPIQRAGDVIGQISATGTI